MGTSWLVQRCHGPKALGPAVLHHLGFGFFCFASLGNRCILSMALRFSISPFGERGDVSSFSFFGITLMAVADRALSRSLRQSETTAVPCEMQLNKMIFPPSSLPFLSQSPGKYKALADCKRRGSEDLLVKNGDEIQLLHEDGEGQW